MIVQFELVDDSRPLENMVMRVPSPPGTQIKSVECGNAEMMGDAVGNSMELKGIEIQFCLILF